MRLLNARTLKLESYVGDCPPYAILSHCWGGEEVVFSDLPNIIEARKKQGFSKVEKACEQAVKDGFKYIWIDTCCIDKSSSAELSEAINSMFAWYKDSGKCYAYLADVDEPEDFGCSKWFTRAWTLQELLAPSSIQTDKVNGMEFFSRQWQKLGSKSGLSSRIAEVSGIGKEYLEGKSILSASISMRMSWAAERQATRAEDIAYSLLGLFDVNMPLLYGEGKLKAFRRLQEEIMKISEDETLLAWEGTDFETDSADVLASDPKDFTEAKHLLPYTSDDPISPYSMTHRGLRICLRIFRLNEISADSEDDLRESLRPLRSPVMIWSGDNDLVWAILKCYIDHDYHHDVAIPLRHVTADIYVRDTSTSVALVPTAYSSSCTLEKEIYIRNSRVLSVSNSVQRRFGFLFRRLPKDIQISPTSYPNEAWNSRDRILQSDKSSQGQRFWHASIALILPAPLSFPTMQCAVRLSLGCENGPALKMPQPWCYLDDELLSPNAFDLTIFHAKSSSQAPRYEMNRNIGFSAGSRLKVSIKSDKVLGQRMFIVDIEYAQANNGLEIREEISQGNTRNFNTEPLEQFLRPTHSRKVGDVAADAIDRSHTQPPESKTYAVTRGEKPHIPHKGVRWSGIDVKDYDAQPSGSTGAPAIIT